MFGVLSELIIPGAIALGAMSLALVGASIGVKMMASSLDSLSNVGPGLKSTAEGIAEVGAAMLSFGAKSIIGKFVGNDGMIDQLTQLSSLGDGLIRTALALDRIASALVKIKDVGEVDVSLLSKATSSTAAPIAVTTDDKNTGNDALLAEFKKFTKLIQDGGIVVNLDGRLVSKQLAHA